MRSIPLLAAAVLFAAKAYSQDICPPTPVYEPCEITVEMTEAEANEHPEPYVSVELRAEFRSPKGGRTTRTWAFWDGGKTFRFRFAPSVAGEWPFRLRSNLPSLDGKILRFQAIEPRTLGPIQIFNTLYFRHAAPDQPHFWMGDTAYKFATTPFDVFRQIVDKRAEQKFNHIRGLLLGFDETAERVLADRDAPDVSHFREVDRRIAYANSKGMIFDLVWAGDQNQLADLLPEREQRDRFIRYVCSRYASYNITWQGLQEFEEYDQGGKLLTELYGYVKRYDPYSRLRSTHALNTSSGLLRTGWMDFVIQQTSDPSLAAVEYALYPVPMVNAEFGYEDSGAGKSHAHHVGPHEIRKRAWRTITEGHYITYGNTGTYGGRKFEPSAQYADSPGVRYLTILHDFFQQTRYFDLQPYYRIAGGRALALERKQYRDDDLRGVEYIVYVEDPKPVELYVADGKYDVSWFNPLDGTWIDQKEKHKGERYRGTPPDTDHDWVLYIRREGRKKTLNNRYILESKLAKVKKAEITVAEVPFDITNPDVPELVEGQEYEFEAVVKEETTATRRMRWLWTAEVAGSGQGHRVLGTARKGKFRVPQRLTQRYPGTVQVRLVGLDGAGRLFEAFKPFRLGKAD